MMEKLLLWLPLLLKGALVSLEVASIGCVTGLVLGLCLGVLTCERLKHSFLAKVLRGYIAVIRGTPLFVQLLMIYYALPELLGLNLSAFAAGCIALGLNSGVYLGELLRGGLNALPQSQWEVVRALGYTVPQALRCVILPQAVRNLLPGVTNELIALVKESSVLMVIGVHELTKAAKDLVATDLQPLPIYLLAAAIYFSLTSAIAWITKRGESYAPH